MPKILNSEFDTNNQNSYIADCFIEAETFNPFKDRVVTQLLKNVEVPGFRKGKAPAHLAMQKVDSYKLQTTVLQESIVKFYPEMETEIKGKLENRVILSTNVDINPEFTKETEDGLAFRVNLTLLPEVNLDKITGLQVVKPTEADIENRVSTEDFLAREKENFLAGFNEFEKAEQSTSENCKAVVDLIEEIKDEADSKRENKAITIGFGVNQFPPQFEKELLGLKAGDSKEFELDLDTNDGKKALMYKVKVHEVLLPKFKSTKELFESSEKVKKQFESEEKFEQMLLNVYNQETNLILDNLTRNRIIRAVIEAVDDFSLENDRVEAEKDRIFNALKKEAENKKMGLVEIFKLSGLPGSDLEVKDDKDVEVKIFDYVKKEFKLIGILQAVYHNKLDESQKIKEAEVEDIQEKIKQNPKEFNVSNDAINNPDELKSLAYDRILRSKSFTWIASQVEMIEQAIETGKEGKSKPKKDKVSKETTDVEIKNPKLKESKSKSNKEEVENKISDKV